MRIRDQLLCVYLHFCESNDDNLSVVHVASDEGIDSLSGAVFR